MSTGDDAKKKAASMIGMLNGIQDRSVHEKAERIRLKKGLDSAVEYVAKERAKVLKEKERVKKYEKKAKAKTRAEAKAAKATR